MIALFLMTSGSAWAFTEPRSGLSVDGSAGLALSGGPIHPGLGLQLSGGWWTGRYDDAYSLGRYWQVGPTLRLDLPFDGTARFAPLIELRRGVEILAGGLAPFVATGPVASVGGDAPGLGITARLGLMGKFRWHRYHGASLRLESGVDVISGKVTFTGGIAVGIVFARPIWAPADPE